ncbi:MAG: hypothetical protein JST84_20115 [Acidobacteria bacterium]|nr:hypothetical protein [Acidobacteriota bacterium]
MNPAYNEFALKPASATMAILLGGLVAGTMDIVAAFIQHGLKGISPIRILQSVASGLLGRESYNGGLKAALLGLLCHFVIALGATATYYALSRIAPVLITQAVIGGSLFGVAVYFFMNLVVLPLSAFPGKITFPLGALVIGLLIHIFCVGLPIALIIRHYSR